MTTEPPATTGQRDLAVEPVGQEHQGREQQPAGQQEQTAGRIEVVVEPLVCGGRRRVGSTWNRAIRTYPAYQTRSFASCEATLSR